MFPPGSWRLFLRRRSTGRSSRWRKPSRSTVTWGNCFMNWLHGVVEFDYLNLTLHDASRNVMRLHILETERPRKIRPGAEFPVGETPSGWVWETQQPFILNDTEVETRYPSLLQILRENGVRSACSVPLTTAQRRLGVLSFGRGTAHGYAETEIAFMQDR